MPVALNILLSIPNPKAHIATQRQILAASFKICTKFSGKNGKDLTQIATRKNSANHGMLFSFEASLFWLKFKKFSKNKKGTSMMTRSIFKATGKKPFLLAFFIFLWLICSSLVFVKTLC